MTPISGCLVRFSMVWLAIGGAGLAAQTPQPGIGLDVDEIQAIANRVRAGRSLQPATWPNGARVAVLLSFDVDNDTIAIARSENAIHRRDVAG